jgi:pimeloyl-ACP methyl ester carboxylesterase
MTRHELVEQLILVNGIRLRAMVGGRGPLVVCVHGFPESWYSWRHQLNPLLRAGFSVCALDVRGYGKSDRPAAVSAYAMRELVADVCGVIETLSPGKPAILVGHDWGAPIVWSTALAMPEKVRAVAGLSVPPLPIGTRPLDEVLHERYTQRGRFHYQVYFAREGVAEQEFEADIRANLRRLYYSASGDAAPGSWSNKPFGARLLDNIEDPVTFPPWLSAADIDYYVGEFERSGLRGPLNRYRNSRADFEFLDPLRDRKIEQPSLYIGGTRDLVLSLIPGGDPLAAMQQRATDVRGAHLLDGCGHWTQQERPAEVTALLLEFLGRRD